MREIMIEKTETELMKESPETVALYLNKAIDKIDSAFGEGYASDHPELVASFIEASAQDFNTAAQLKVLEDQIGRLIYSLDSIADAINT